jgi:hypothetical protein
MKHIQEIAIRLVNGDNQFLENAMKFSGCTKSEAEIILKVYRKIKAVKRDVGSGQWKVMHGIYWEKEHLLNAITYKL